MDTYVPGEEHAQSCVWMAWPSSELIWGKSLLRKVQDDIALLIRTILKYEEVVLLVNGSINALQANDAIFDKKYLKTKDLKPNFQITFIEDIPVDDCWMRDIGPIFRLCSTNNNDSINKIDAISLNFNGWGNKQRHQNDKMVASSIAKYLGIPLVAPGCELHGEGGGVEQDGAGTLYATDSCWVNKNRNPNMSKQQIESELLLLYGCTKMIWLPGAKGCDITDDHIDGFLRVVRPGVLLLSSDSSKLSNIDNGILQLLKDEVDAQGNHLQIHVIHTPVNCRVRDKMLLKSYLNYIVINGAVINMQFGDAEKDRKAEQTLQLLYPGRRIEMLPLDGLYSGGGGIHCVTQQQPKI